jgi:choline dehydrogenase
MLRGSPADYDEWGEEWGYERLQPFLERAGETLRTAPRNTDSPVPFHLAFVEAAHAVGFELLDDPDDPDHPVGIGSFPANVVDGRRWNSAFAYLDAARDRPNLTIVDQTRVDRVLLEGKRAMGVVAAHGRRFEAETVVLAAGAYFSPAILCRSGVGPEPDLRALGIDVVEALPVGERLLDHCGSGIGWEPTEALHEETARHELEHDLYQAHVVLKGASGSCTPGSWDLHFLSWIDRAAEPGRYEVSTGFFHMKPLSTGRVRLRSTDPAQQPLIERGFLARDEDLSTLLDAIEIGRSLAATEPLARFVTAELRPGPIDPERYLRETIRNYFHPAGTCPLHEVVDTDCRVLGLENLLVGDASVMPTIPRANTNLTTAAIAERVAAGFR